MADRKASVSLELRAGQFKAEATEVEAKVEGIDRKVKEVDRSITKIPPDAAKAAAAMKLLGDESGKVGEKFDDLGRSVRVTALGGIDQQVTKTRAELRKLADEFNRTGNLDVFQQLLGKQADLRNLEKTGQRIVDALGRDGKLAGMEFTKNFSAATQGAFSTPAIGPIIVVGIIAAIVAASPAIGAMLNGALLAGIGLGGIGLGIIGQLHDPRVKAEFQALGAEVGRWLGNATSSFQQPLLEAGRILAGTLDAIGPRLARDLSGLAQYVRPLTDGLQRLFLNMQPGLDKAFAAAGPLLKEFADQLPGLGTALSSFFSSLSDHAQGAKEGLRTIFVVIEQLLIATGNLVSFLTQTYQGFVGFADVITGFFAKLLGWVPLLGGYLDRIHQAWADIRNGAAGAALGPVTAMRNIGEAAVLTADQLSALQSKISATAVTADTLAASMSQRLFTTIMNVDQATLGWDKSLLDLHDTLSNNGLAVDRHSKLVATNTQAGIANREAVLAAMTANMQQYQAFIAAGGSAEDATKAYDTNTTALEKQLRAAGYNTAQIDDMIGSLKNVPRSVQADIAMNGLTTAIEHMSDLLAYINHINGRNIGFTVHETDMRTEINEPGNFGHVQRWGGIYQHAATGLLNAGIYSTRSPARYAFAEPATGGEGFVPRLGNYARSTAIIDQEARWYGGRFMPGGGSAPGRGGGQVQVQLVLSGGDAATTALLSTLHKAVNSRGGDVQLAVMGRPSS